MPATAAPDVALAWTQNDLSVKAYEGTSNTQNLNFSFSGNVAVPGVAIDGNLRDVVAVDFKTTTVTGDGTANVTMTITVPAQAKDSYVGNIQLTDNGKPLPQPLHVAVTTAHWDSQTIPDEPTIPSPDRVALVEGTPVVSDQLTVAIGDGVADPDALIREIASSYGAQITGSVQEYGVYDLRLAGATADRVEAARLALRSRSEIAGAGYSYLAGTSSYTSDPVWSPTPDSHPDMTWNLTQIDAPSAWDESTGEGVSVGVVDAGFYPKHIDLSRNVSRVSSPTKVDAHGTHVSGSACADGNNGNGSVGVAWRCKLNLQTVGSMDYTYGNFSTELSAISSILSSMRTIAQSTPKPRVVNMSVGMQLKFDCTRSSLTTKQAQMLDDFDFFGLLMRKTAQKNPSILWVIAGANEPQPARCSAFGGLGTDQSLPNVVTVAASTRDAKQASYSAYGDGITVAAPGGEVNKDRTQVVDGVFSTNAPSCNVLDKSCTGAGYFYDAGTSMAAPHVTGTAALAFAAKPTLQPADVKKCLIDAAAAGGKKIPGQSYSIINSKKTVDCALGKLNQQQGTLSNVQTVVPGGNADYALKKDGTVWAWGGNGSGELGNGTNGDSITPVQVAGLSDVSALAASSGNAFALKKDGSLWGWGYNGQGALGTGNMTNSSTPVQVPGLPPIVSVATRYGSTYAVGSDGSVWAWGNNFMGVLGNGSDINAYSPVRIPVPEAATSVYTGGYTAYVLTSRGSVWSWGDNGQGQLGNGTTTASKTPVPVTGLSGAKSLVTTRGSVVYALMPDQTVKVWGEGSGGALGNGTYGQSSVPIDVPNVAPVTQLAAAPGYTFARQGNGTVLAWGNGWNGALGTGNTNTTATPTPVVGISNAVSVATGGFWSLALLSDGTVRSWGVGYRGTLGNGTLTESNPVPVNVTGLSGVVSIIANSNTDTAYAVTSDGSVWSWGSTPLGRSAADQVSAATPAPI